MLEKLGACESRSEHQPATARASIFFSNANSFVVSQIVKQKIKQLIGIGCRKIMSGNRKMGHIEQRMEQGPQRMVGLVNSNRITGIDCMNLLDQRMTVNDWDVPHNNALDLGLAVSNIE